MTSSNSTISWSCPVCRNLLSPNDQFLECHRCPRQFGFERGIPVLLPENEPPTLVQSQFENLWDWWGNVERFYGRTPDEWASFIREGYSGIDPDALKGCRVLDAGCGHGSFARAFALLGADVVGLELGQGVHLAARTCADVPVQLIRANLLHLPFQDGEFDYIFCHGVLPFLPEPEEGFRSLARVLRPGGHLRIWVYPRGSWWWEALQGALRAVTTRLPAALLRALCYVPVPLLGIFGSFSGTSLANSSWKECAQVVWDFYSPRIQWHFGEAEIADWYLSGGFEPPQFLSPPTNAIGRKRLVTGTKGESDD